MSKFPIYRRRFIAGAGAVLAGAHVLPAFAQPKTPLYGGTLVMGLGSEPGTLNINLTTDLPVSLIASNLYNRLVNLGPKGEFTPELATSWETTPDGRKYTFHLAKGVKWHDGRPFTSADVTYTLDEMVRKSHPNGSAMFAWVESIEAPDADTVVVNLKSPYEPFIGFLALRVYMLPRHLFENRGEIRQNPANTRPVGTGPYKFVEWQRGSHVTLEKNTAYFRPGEPYLDRFVYRIIPDPAARVLALETGEIDYLCQTDLPSSAIPTLQKNKNVVVTFKGTEAIDAITQIMFNHDRKPFNDVRVRRAIAHAVNRQFVIDRAALGIPKVASSPINSTTEWAYNPDVRLYPFDTAAANRLLDEAGLPKGADGVRLRTTILAPRGRDDQTRAAEIVAQQLKEIGIAAGVSILDTATLADVSYVKRDFDMMINLLTTGPDPAVGVQRQYVSSNIRPVPFSNASAYRNATVDRLFAEAETAPNTAERATRYKEIQKILADDAVVLWLWEVSQPSAWRDDFENMHTSSTASNYVLARAWSRKGKRAG